MQSLLTHVQAGWQLAATVENIGLGGARLVVEKAIAVGDAITASFAAPNARDRLVLRARVAWVAHGETPVPLGVAFAHDTPDAVFALYELIVAFGYE